MNVMKISKLVIIVTLLVSSCLLYQSGIINTLLGLMTGIKLPGLHARNKNAIKNGGPSMRHTTQKPSFTLPRGVTTTIKPINTLKSSNVTRAVNLTKAENITISPMAANITKTAKTTNITNSPMVANITKAAKTNITNSPMVANPTKASNSTNLPNPTKATKLANATNSTNPTNPTKATKLANATKANNVTSLTIQPQTKNRTLTTTSSRIVTPLSRRNVSRTSTTRSPVPRVKNSNLPATKSVSATTKTASKPNRSNGKNQKPNGIVEDNTIDYKRLVCEDYLKNAVLESKKKADAAKNESKKNKNHFGKKTNVRKLQRSRRKAKAQKSDKNSERKKEKHAAKKHVRTESDEHTSNEQIIANCIAYLSKDVSSKGATRLEYFLNGGLAGAGAALFGAAINGAYKVFIACKSGIIAATFSGGSITALSTTGLVGSAAGGTAGLAVSGVSGVAAGGSVGGAIGTGLGVAGGAIGTGLGVAGGVIGSLFVAGGSTGIAEAAGGVSGSVGGAVGSESGAVSADVEGSKGIANSVVKLAKSSAGAVVSELGEIATSAVVDVVEDAVSSVVGQALEFVGQVIGYGLGSLSEGAALPAASESEPLAETVVSSLGKTTKSMLKTVVDSVSGVGKRLMGAVSDYFNFGNNNEQPPAPTNLTSGFADAGSQNEAVRSNITGNFVNEISINDHSTGFMYANALDFGLYRTLEDMNNATINAVLGNSAKIFEMASDIKDTNQTKGNYTNSRRIGIDMPDFNSANDHKLRHTETKAKDKHFLGHASTYFKLTEKDGNRFKNAYYGTKTKNNTSETAMNQFKQTNKQYDSSFDYKKLGNENPLRSAHHLDKNVDQGKALSRELLDLLMTAVKKGESNIENIFLDELREGDYKSLIMTIKGKFDELIAWILEFGFKSFDENTYEKSVLLEKILNRSFDLNYKRYKDYIKEKAKDRPIGLLNHFKSKYAGEFYRCREIFLEKRIKERENMRLKFLETETKMKFLDLLFRASRMNNHKVLRDTLRMYILFENKVYEGLVEKKQAKAGGNSTEKVDTTDNIEQASLQ